MKKTRGVPMSAAGILEQLAGLNRGLPELDFIEELLRGLKLARQCLVGRRAVQAPCCYAKQLS